MGLTICDSTVSRCNLEMYANGIGLFGFERMIGMLLSRAIKYLRSFPLALTLGEQFHKTTKCYNSLKIQNGKLIIGTQKQYLNGILMA